MQGTKWALGFVMVIFGFLMMTQFRIQQQVPADPGRLRADELSRMLKATQEQLQASDRERNRLQAELIRLENESAAPMEPGPIEMLAGTVGLSGPGLVITLSESDTSAARTRIADEDLWLVINELLASGAEGVAVNGNRISALSGIRNVGQRMMIHQSMTASPFEIAVIGDPTVMETALRMRGGVADTLDRWGIKIRIQRHESLQLPALRAVPSFQFAKPAR